jgi:hypothetical protein
MNTRSRDLLPYKFKVIRALLSRADCAKLARALLASFRAGHFHSGDRGVSQSYSKYAHPLTEDLLLELLPRMRAETGQVLEPTYSYLRIYTEGAVLKKHRDREACEFSVTLNLACASEPWPIWIDNGVKSVSIALSPGDGLLYKGCECPHWREVLQGAWNLQVFLHYIDSKGPFADLRFDGRDTLNLTQRATLA